LHEDDNKKEEKSISKCRIAKKKVYRRPAKCQPAPDAGTAALAAKRVASLAVHTTGTANRAGNLAADFGFTV